MRTTGMGGHQSANSQTVEWLTPPYILEELGPFDLDPCCPESRPWDTARTHYTQEDCGDLLPWFGRIWLNPPYGEEVWRWLELLANHRNGIALIFARTETEGFHRWVWRQADGLLFLKGRLTFYRPDGSLSSYNAGAPSVLVGYGSANIKRLKGSGLVGHYVELAKG